MENQDFLFDAADTFSEKLAGQSGEISYDQSRVNTTNPFDKTKNQFNYEVYPVEPDDNAESDYGRKQSLDFDNQMENPNKIPIDTRALTMIDEI